MAQRVESAFKYSSPRQAVNTVINAVERFLGRRRLASYPPAVNVQVTDRCNLSCSFCPQPRKTAGELSAELVDKVSTLAKRSRELALCGYGEPLMSQSFYHLLEKARSGRISFVTNGLMLTPDVLDNIFSGSRRPVYSIAFLIDGASRRTYERVRQGSDFTTVWDNVDSLVSYQEGKRRRLPYLWVDFTAMRLNVSELSDLVRKAALSGLDGVNVSHVLVRTEEYKDESLVFHYELAQKAFREAKLVASAAKIKLDLPAIPSLLNNNASNLPKCCEPWRSAFIKHDGTVMACCHSDELVMGNLYEEAFHTIWNNSKYQTLRAKVNHEPLEACLTCKKRFRYHNSSNDPGVYLKLASSHE